MHGTSLDLTMIKLWKLEGRKLKMKFPLWWLFYSV